MDRHIARVNRTHLAVVGVLLVAGGGLAIVRGRGLLPGLPAGQPLLNEAERAFARGHDWFWYAVAAGAVVIALIAVRWLLAQGRTGTIRTLRVDDPTGRTRLPARAAGRAVAADLAALPAVRRSTALLTGAPSAPRLRLHVTADARCDWPALRGGLTGTTLTNLRTALERDHIPARVRVRLADTGPGRDIR
jgi:hypothetical protein